MANKYAQFSQNDFNSAVLLVRADFSDNVNTKKIKQDDLQLRVGAVLDAKKPAAVEELAILTGTAIRRLYKIANRDQEVGPGKLATFDQALTHVENKHKIMPPTLKATAAEPASML